MITKKLVENMYNPESDGVIQLKNAITESELIKINNEVEKSKHLFVPKIEKYIDNNQDVALIYRGKFCLDGLDNTIFEKLFKQYIEIRKQVMGFSEENFTSGNILEAKIIRYPVSDLGVATHRDLSSNVNFITFFNLIGSANFYTYDDKDGNGKREYLMESGDISLMRGPRSESENNIRPLHGIEKVTTERVVLAIREINTDMEEVVNKGNWMGF
jgi:hypothetical protein